MSVASEQSRSTSCKGRRRDMITSSVMGCLRRWVVFTGLVVLNISGMALIAAPTASAQQLPNSGQATIAGSPTVKQILIRGNQRIEADTVRSYLIIQPGQTVTQQSLDVALKTLFNTGLFEDAQLELENGSLIVTVKENPIVNRVLYEGNKRIKEDKFAEEVQFAPRSIFTSAKAQADVQRLIEIYRRSGRFATTITPKIVRLPQNRVDVIFEIDEGPTTGVAKINFLGNKAFTSNELNEVVLTAESRWWNLFESNDNFDPDRLDYDRELLRQFYTKNGYADFQVVSAVAELTPDRRNFFITFTVDEGPQYKFGKIDVKTSLSKIDPVFLERSLPIRPGTTFNSEIVESATESITYSTGIAGYAFVDVNPKLQRNTEARTVDITFVVNEGPRVYVERIDIHGNIGTLDRVIRREMRLVEGDAFNRILVDRSKRKIKSLTYFKEVEITELPGSAPDRTILDVAVEEQSTGSFSIGAGISSTDRFVANMSVEQRNLLGRGQYLKLDLRASTRTSNAIISFREPYFLDRTLSAGFDLFANNTDFREAGFVRESFGAGVNIGFPISEFGRLGLNYTLRDDNVLVDSITSINISSANEVANFLSPDAVANNSFTLTPTPTGFQLSAQLCDFQVRSIDPTCESRGQFLTSSFGYSLNFDTRNDYLAPSRGWKASFSQSFAGLGGDVKYLRSQFNGAYYKQLPFDLVGAAKLNIGYVDGWGDNGVRLQDRFLRGGSTFRGFELAGVGPRFVTEGNSGRAIGGKAYAVGAFEIAFPLPLPEQYGLRTAFFTEFGTVGLVDENDKVLNNNLPTGLGPGERGSWVDYNNDGILDQPVQDDLSLRLSAGLSINWNSPFGPVQIDIAQPILREDYDRTESFRFSAGTQF